METDSTDILDLLFDDGGILKPDVMKINDSLALDNRKQLLPSNTNNFSSISSTFDDAGIYDQEISNINFGDFDLTENLFEALLNQAEPNSLLDYESSSKCNPFHTDHTYIAHKSPSQNSDSGISIVSDDLANSNSQNMTDDQQLEKLFNDNLTYDMGAEKSPASSSSDTHIFDMLGVDDSTELMEECLDTSNSNTNLTGDDVEDYDLSPGINDDEFSIDFDMSDLMQFPASLTSKGTQSILLVDNSTKKIIPLKRTNKDNSSLPFTVQDIDSDILSHKSNFPELRLTDEEKDLINKEGYTLPSHLPLTREEERVLKSVRRKIRNKISAKESRKRKQTYVDGLEQRVKMCTAENRELQKKVNNLEKQNVTLISQLKKIQSLVGKTKLPAHSSTCVMVLLLSLALFVIPSFNPFGSSDNHSPVDMSNSPVRGKARSLLGADHANEMTDSSDEDPYGVTTRPPAPWNQVAIKMSTVQKVLNSPEPDVGIELFKDVKKEVPNTSQMKVEEVDVVAKDVNKIENDLKFVKGYDVDNDLIRENNLTAEELSNSEVMVEEKKMTMKHEV